MTALSTGASLTRYHSRYPAFDGAKLLLFKRKSREKFHNRTLRCIFGIRIDGFGVESKEIGGMFGLFGKLV